MINLAKEYVGNQGYLCKIGYNRDVDYLQMAYLQALSIKTTQKTIKNYAVIVDQKINNLLEEKHRKLFDSVVVIDEDWSFKNEWKIRNYSPWKKTIKLDADLIFTRDISHWWEYFSQWSLLFTNTVEDYKHRVIKSRWHRKLFDANTLPDIYTAFFYFKDDIETAEFFKLVKEIGDDWEWFAKEFLIKNTNPLPRDDEIFSIAAEIYGTEKCILPGASFPKFVHMKEALNELVIGTPWHEQIHFENNNNQIWIGNYLQHLPFHYCSKTFVSQELVKIYEQNHRKLMESVS